MNRLSSQRLESAGIKVMYRYALDHIPYFSGIESVIDAVNKAVNERS